MQRVSYPSWANYQTAIKTWGPKKSVVDYPNISAFGSDLVAAEQNARANLMGVVLGSKKIREVVSVQGEIFEDGRKISDHWGTPPSVSVLYAQSGQAPKYLFILHVDQLPASKVVVYSMDA